MADTLLIDGSPVRSRARAAEPRKDPGAPASVVNHYIAPAPTRHLPHMLIATTLVAVLPLALSLTLRASGVISGWVSVPIAVAMSLAFSTAGSAYWRKRGGHGEVLFGELLLWGWVRSWRQERELANATRLLDLVDPDPARAEVRDELSVERREHLLRQLAGALEGQDIYLNGHSRRVARHATMIARGMGLSSEDVARIRAAAAVHDVGKLLTPKAVLNKPGRLTDEEFEVIKLHPVDGAEMVAALGDPELTRIVRHHHERLDGAGYPDRLRGEEIPLGARIIAVADTFDAITSARPYRAAAPHQKAIDILRKEAGSQLDPDAVRSFLAYYSGNRPTVVWAVITSSVRRVVSWLTGDPAAAATISAGKVAAATVATAAIGAAAGAAPVRVVHHPARPARAHSAPARPHGVALGLRRQGTSVVVPAAGPAPAAHASTPPAAASAKTRRSGAHQATAHHAAAKGRRTAGGAGKKALSRPGASHAGTTTAGAHSQARSQSRAASGSVTTGAQGAVKPAASTRGAGATKPSNPSTASHSQGSNAKGNTYGHSKPLGGGHGKGVAAGHANSNPAPTPSSQSSATANGAAHSNANANVPTTVPSGAANQGGAANQSGGSSNGQGSSSSQGSSNSQGSEPSQSGTHPSASQTPSTAASQTGDGQGNNGQGNSGHGDG